MRLNNEQGTIRLSGAGVKRAVMAGGVRWVKGFRQRTAHLSSEEEQAAASEQTPIMMTSSQALLEIEPEAMDSACEADHGAAPHRVIQSAAQDFVQRGIQGSEQRGTQGSEQSGNQGLEHSETQQLIESTAQDSKAPSTRGIRELGLRPARLQGMETRKPGPQTAMPSLMLASEVRGPILARRKQVQVLREREHGLAARQEAGASITGPPLA